MSLTATQPQLRLGEYIITDSAPSGRSPLVTILAILAVIWLVKQKR